MDRSKLTIVFIMLVATGSGVFAWWHQYQQSGRVLALWGSKSILLVRDAPRVELLELTASTAAAENTSPRSVIHVGSEQFDVAQRSEISSARGLIHARHALIDNASFAWDTSSDCLPEYAQALRFSTDQDVATFLLDLKCRSIYLLEQDREATLTEFAATALGKYLSELSAQRSRNQVGK